MRAEKDDFREMSAMKDEKGAAFETHRLATSLTPISLKKKGGHGQYSHSCVDRSATSQARLVLSIGCPARRLERPKQTDADCLLASPPRHSLLE
jgi:hypothetical protein